MELTQLEWENQMKIQGLNVFYVLNVCGSSKVVLNPNSQERVLNAGPFCHDIFAIVAGLVPYR